MESLEPRLLLSASIIGYVLQSNGAGGVPGVTVFLDANRNGVVDAGERTVLTDAHGRYEFTNTPAGKYNVAALVKDSNYWTAETFGRLIGLGSWEDSGIIGPWESGQTRDDYAALWEIDPETGFAINSYPIVGSRGFRNTDPHLVNYAGLTAVPNRPGWYLSQIQDQGSAAWNLFFECEARLAALHWEPGMAFTEAFYVTSTGHDLTYGGGLDFDPTGGPNVVYGGLGDDYIWPWNVLSGDNWLWKVDLTDIGPFSSGSTDIGELGVPGHYKAGGDLQFDGNGNLYLFKGYLYRLDKTTGQELERIEAYVGEQAAEWNPQTLTFWTAGTGLRTVNPANANVTIIRSSFDFGIPDGPPAYQGGPRAYLIEGLEYIPDGFSDRPVELGNTDVAGINFSHTYHAVSIRGKVIRDANSNGVRDSGENQAMAGQRVFLDANGNNRYDDGEIYCFTNAQGGYEFLDQPAGVYRIVLESVFGGDDVTWGGNVRPGLELVNLIEGQYHTVDFGIGPAGTVRGRLFDDLNADGIHQGQLVETVVGWDSPGVAIPDMGMVSSTIRIDQPGPAIVDVNVYLDITHTWVGDLRVELVSPAGTRVQLFERIGGSGDNITGCYLDDEASASIDDVTSWDAPFTGAYRPEQPLSAFDGEQADGLWTLEIHDEAGGDIGTLNLWGLIIYVAGPAEPGLAGVTVYVDLDNNGALNTMTVQGNSTAPKRIPDLGTAYSTISISNVHTPIADVDVYLDITHGRVADLIIDLISPQGTRVRLTRLNGESGRDFTGTIFDDEATFSIEDAVAQDNPFTGWWRPYSMLADFDGELPAGPWTLEVTDVYAGVSGMINFWSLRLTLGDIVTTTDADGFYEFKDLPPGPWTIRQQLSHQRSPTHPRPAGETVLERFEIDLSRYVQREAGGGSVLSAAAAYEGGLGLIPGRWLVGTTEAPIVRKGDTISVHLMFPAGAAGGWAWLGFGAYDGGTLAVAVHPGISGPGGGPGRLAIWQWTGGWDTAAVRTYCLTEVTLGYLSSDVWYRLDVEWGLTNTIIAKLYSADGSPATAWQASALAAWPVEQGALAFRGKLSAGFPDFYFDCISVRRDIGQSILASSNLGGLVSFGSAADGVIAGTVFQDVNGNGIIDHDRSMAGVRVYYDANINGIFDTQSAVPTNYTNWGIHDRATTVSEIKVSEMPGVVRDVAVLVDIDHLNVGDLSIHLVSPWGTCVQLVNNIGGSNDHYDWIWFRDDAATSIASATWPLSGNYKPQGRLADFRGEDPNGVWRLVVTDNTANGIQGMLDTFAINLTSGDLDTITDANGFYFGAELPARWYFIREEVPSGWVQTAPRPLSWHVLPMGGGQVLWPVNFGNTRVGTLAGAVWHDRDSGGQRDPEDEGVPGQILYLDINRNGSRDIYPEQSIAQFNPVSIPDLRTVTSLMPVGGLSGRVLDVNVRLTIDHTYNGDLTVFLHSPQGTRVKLFDRIGGSSDGFVDTVLDDQAATPITSGVWPYTGAYRPQEPLGILTGQDPNGVWMLVIVDNAGGDSGTLVDWEIRLTTGDPVVTTGTGGDYQFINVLPATYSVRLENDPGWLWLDPAYGLRTITVLISDHVTGADFTLKENENPASVIATRVFYNNSCLDGHDPAVNAADDSAIDPGKTALLPGGPPGAANVTGYSRGLNGIMIDVDRLLGTPSASDFILRTGNGGDPATWAAAPQPKNVTVRLGAGPGGSARITMLWADNNGDSVVDPTEAVAGGWLQVTVLPTIATGLAEPHVFYFGNLPADANGSGQVDLDDFVILKVHFGQPSAGIGNGDFDLSGTVDLDDFVILKQRFGSALSGFSQAVGFAGSADLLTAEPLQAGAAGQTGPVVTREPMTEPLTEQPETDSRLSRSPEVQTIGQRRRLLQAQTPAPIRANGFTRLTRIRRRPFGGTSKPNMTNTLDQFNADDVFRLV